MVPFGCVLQQLTIRRHETVLAQAKLQGAHIDEPLQCVSLCFGALTVCLCVV